MTERRVLLVEDDSDDIDLALFAFKECNFAYPVDVARDGAEALDRLSASNELPALVLLDIKLPKVNGLEVLALVRADPRLSQLLVVILSGSDEPQDKKEAARLGAACFFNKPVGLDGFVKIVHALENLLSRRSAQR
jgi:two-component system response regulator